MPSIVYTSLTVLLFLMFFLVLGNQTTKGVEFFLTQNKSKEWAFALPLTNNEVQDLQVTYFLSHSLLVSRLAGKEKEARWGMEKKGRVQKLNITRGGRRRMMELRVWETVRKWWSLCIENELLDWKVQRWDINTYCGSIEEILHIYGDSTREMLHGWLPNKWQCRQLVL